MKNLISLSLVAFGIVVVAVWLKVGELFPTLNSTTATLATLLLAENIVLFGFFLPIHVFQVGLKELRKKQEKRVARKYVKDLLS